MYDIKWIRENPDVFDRGLKRRGLEPLSDKILKIDSLRLARLRVFEGWQARLNAASKKIGEAKRAKDEPVIQSLMAEVQECKTSLSTLESELRDSDEELSKALVEIPNLPFEEPDVPTGSDANDNRIERTVGEKPKYNFTPKQHFELGESLGQMNFELAAKLAGARFVVLQKGLARLERALGQFMLDVHTAEGHGYTEVNPPLLVNSDVMFGTAQLPKFRDDQFSTKAEEVVEPDEFEIEIAEPGSIRFKFRGPRRELLERSGVQKVFLDHPQIFEDKLTGIKPIIESVRWLIPTAEVPLTNLVRESIVEEAQLPMRLTACTPCFRAEAGAAGKDTRGMIRQHQFTKVELVSITTPEKSKDEHDRMLACAEEVLKKLDLHYRVVTLCTGDMGFAAQKTYDIEVWLPGQNMYREISSCSNCGEFQARRMNARFKGKDGKAKGHVHTLNGSGVAVGRALIAVMETYQQEDGSIAVPGVLEPYMGGITRIERN